MTNFGWDDRQKGQSLAERLESPFLEEELFVEEHGQEWESPVTSLEAESPFRRAFEHAQAMAWDTEILNPEVMEWETGAAHQSGVSSVAVNSIKQWPGRANRPASWQGKIYGLVVHTSGSGIPKRAEEDRVSPTKWAMGYYKKSRGCHYVNGWGGIEGSDLVQIANENFEAWGVGYSTPKDPKKDQRQSILAGRFAMDLPPVLVNLWRKRWPTYKHSLQLLPGTKTANSCYVHVECLPCVYHGPKKGLTIGAPPLQTRPKLRFTKAQHDAVAQLAVDIARRNGWPMSETWWRSPRLLGHEDLTPISRHDKHGGWDPGYLRDEPYFDWDYVYGVIESILQGTGTTPTAVGSSIGSGIVSALGNVAQRFSDLVTAGKERLALSLAYGQGKRDENTLTSLIFHTRHPELGGRRIRKEEQSLAQEWLKIRADLVRPFLQSASASEMTAELDEDFDEEVELPEPFSSESGDQDLLAEPELAYESEEDFEDYSEREDIPSDEYESDQNESEEAESIEEEACGLEMEADEAGVESFSYEASLEEWENPFPTSSAFPSGVTLPMVTGLPEGQDQEYWDPSPLYANTTRNPLLDTGPAQKKKRLSANFTAGELSTSGGHSADVARIDPRLVQALQRLRDYVGKPIKITSGYRSWKRNKAIYAARDKEPTRSQHCGGRAADIKIDGMNGLQVARAAIDALGPNIGVGLGKTFAHIDIRGVPIAWNYGGVSNQWVTEIKRYQKSKARARESAEEEVAKLPAELVHFAQRVLNVAESGRLQEDGKFGRLTGGALQRFRTKYGLGTGAILDTQTELALAQRALETLAQASMFAQLGTPDARTNEALITFKSTRQLGSTPDLDAPTRQALGEALGRIGAIPQPGGASTLVSTPPSAYAGGKLWTFSAATRSLRVAVFCPPAALSKGNLEILVYAHGLLNPCKKPRSIPGGIITESPFKLGDIVAGSGQPVVLVVPYLDWSNPGGAAVFGKDRRKWHALGKPSHLNALIDEVLIEVGRVQSMPKPELANLMIAGHSRAYDFLEPLAHSHADPDMKQGNLAKLSQVWAFDTTYAGNLRNWLSWLKENPKLKVTLFYRPNSRTEAIGRKFESNQSSQLRVIDSKEGHCAVPAKRLPGLLNPAMPSPSPEMESPWTEIQTQWEDWDLEVEEDELQTEEAEATYDENWADAAEFDEIVENEYEADEHQHVHDFGALEQELLEEVDTPTEPELEALAFEAMGTAEEYFDEESEEDFEAQIMEEVSSQRKPLPVPVHHPVPFAPLPPIGSYWPLRTAAPEGRVVSYIYLEPKGIVGSPGRRFLANRAAKRAGKPVGRWHAGVDLFARKRDIVVACESGTIVDFSFFYKAKSGQNTYRLLIEHDGSGVVVNYGEITGDSLEKNGLKVGMRVAAGQPIGFVSDTAMLHFETYTAGTETSHRWWKDEKIHPPQLLNPTEYLLFLREHGLPARGVDSPAVTTPSVSSNKDLIVTADVLNVRASPSQESKIIGKLRKGEVVSWLGSSNDAQWHRVQKASLTGWSFHRYLTARTPQQPRPANGLPKLGAGLTVPTNPEAFRKFRLTTYYVVDQNELPTTGVSVPIYDQNKNKIAEGSPAFFAKLSLEGTGLLNDKRLINVTGKTVTVSHEEYAAVLAYHQQAYAKRDQKRRAEGRDPTPTSYSGIVLQNNRIVKAMAFHEVETAKRGIGYGLQRGVPYVPFRTLAADIGYGKYSSVEPKWKDKGGVVPPGTHVYIKEFDGLSLPDGTRHDGWFIVNDTGGAIFGAHFDVFAGTLALAKQVKLPQFGNVWFDGIEQRVPVSYSYGLKP